MIQSKSSWNRRRLKKNSENLKSFPEDDLRSIDRVCHIVGPRFGTNFAFHSRRRHRRQPNRGETRTMSTYHWQRRWDPFREFQREVGRLFETLEPVQHWRVARGVPPINLYDAGERYVLTAQLPGIGSDEVDLSITGETLTIRGDRKRPEGVTEESYRRQERQFGRWTRTVTLPDRVDSGAVSASFANGVLTVTLPKADEAKPRQISVTPAANA
jgi:HSP20 family protein